MEEDQKKRFIMRAGIGLIMGFILIFWFFNTRQAFKSQASDNESENWTELKAQWGEAVSDMNDTFKEFSTATSTISTTSDESALVAAFVSETGKLASSSVSTSTIISTGTPVFPISPAAQSEASSTEATSTPRQ